MWPRWIRLKPLTVELVLTGKEYRRIPRKSPTITRRISMMKRHLKRRHTMNFIALQGLVNQKNEVSGRLVEEAYTRYSGWLNYERTLNSLYTDEMMENVKGFIHVITGRRSWSAGHWGSNLKPFGWPILPAGLFTAGWEHVCREAPLLTWGVLVWGSCWAHPGPFQPVSHLHPHHPRSPASSPPCPDAHTHKHTHHIRA